MRVGKIIFAVSFILFVAALVRFFYIKGKNDAVAASSTQVEKNQSTTSRFSETIKNMGAGKRNVPVVAEFVIYNTGLRDLFIERVDPDCHCTSVEFSHGNILPNDSSIIKLVYDAVNEGPYQSTATVTTNSENQPATLLIFRGIINAN